MWFALISPALAATLTVGPTGDFPSVRGAVESANAGDTLLVEPGVYGALLDLGIPLTIRSTQGAEVTTLHIDSTHARNTAIAVRAAVVLEGFTITTNHSHQRCVRVFGPEGTLQLADARIHDCGQADGLGSGIRVEGGASLTVDRTLFEDNGVTGNPSRGAHIWSMGESVVVRDSVFRRASTELGDGAAFYAGAGSVTLERNLFADNAAGDDGGAVYAEFADPIVVAHNTFTGNTAGALAGGLYVGNTGDHDIAWNLFCHNSAGTRGGGAFFRRVQPGPTMGAVHNNAFLDNTAAERGGAVFTFEAAVELHNNHFLANSSPQGGAVATHFSQVSMTNNLVAHTRDGSGLWVDLPSAVARLDYNAWHANTGGHTTGNAGLGPNDVLADPELERFLDDGACGRGEVLAPAVGSPLIDMGDPALLDPDGSRSDIGAYGGPGAEPCVFEGDDDGDGVCNPLEDGYTPVDTGDTGAPTDPGRDTGPADTDNPQPGDPDESTGCGCSGTRAGGVWGLALVLALARRSGPPSRSGV